MKLFSLLAMTALLLTPLPTSADDEEEIHIYMYGEQGGVQSSIVYNNEANSCEVGYDARGYPHFEYDESERWRCCSYIEAPRLQYRWFNTIRGKGVYETRTINPSGELCQYGGRNPHPILHFSQQLQYRMYKGGYVTDAIRNKAKFLAGQECPHQSCVVTYGGSIRKGATRLHKVHMVKIGSPEVWIMGLFRDFPLSITRTTWKRHPRWTDETMDSWKDGARRSNKLFSSDEGRAAFADMHIRALEEDCWEWIPETGCKILQSEFPDDLDASKLF